MVQDRGGLASRQLEVLWASGTFTGMSDAQLVSRFTGVRDTTAESAFRELVHRHGPMVMGVCRQVLRRAQDAEDAFQATFLILVRKARSVQVRESLAPWLYSVAYSDGAAGASHRRAFPPGRKRSTGIDQGCRPRTCLSSIFGPFSTKSSAVFPTSTGRPSCFAISKARRTKRPPARSTGRSAQSAAGLSRGRELLKSRLERRGVAVPSAILAGSNWNVSQALLGVDGRIHSHGRDAVRDRTNRLSLRTILDPRSLESHVAQQAENSVTRSSRRRWRFRRCPGVGAANI